MCVSVFSDVKNTVETDLVEKPKLIPWDNGYTQKVTK